MSLKFTTRWTDANGKGWISSKPEGRSATLHRLQRILRQKRTKKTHATLITIILNS